VNDSRKTILFVDDDGEFMELIQTLASQSRATEWNVFTATTTAQALRFLGSNEVHLAVLDLRMPIVDGVQFLQLVHRKYPQMKKVLLSSYPDDARRQNAIQHGAEMVLSKPLGADGFEILFETLSELLQTRTEDGFRGMLRKIGLEDILQMECLSRHTSVLEVAAQGRTGRIYIKGGKLVHAEFGSETGETALNRLLALRGGEFLHAAYTEPARRTLDGSWEFLLMEAARKRDEMTAAVEDVAEGPAASASTGLSAVKEIVVAAERGQVLYSRGSTDAAARAAVLVLLHNVSRLLEQSQPFGPLERVDFIAEPERMVARVHEQGGVFVRGCIEA
jgi:CheY-like chemotaxis protein